MRDIITSLKTPWYSDDYGLSKDDVCEKRNTEARQAADEIERLRFERDKARLKVCLLSARIECGNLYPLSKAMEIARRFGWDCFKEDA